MPVTVGIDLGTTFSAVARIDHVTGKPEIVLNSDNRKITPSVIWFSDGECIFGSEAEEAFQRGEPDCAAAFKRDMGNKNVIFSAEGNDYTAQDLSALLLMHLKEDAEQRLNDTICDAVITVPAYFYSDEREATLNAAKTAGINVKKIIDEPNAAALAYGINNWRENANILVYDLGGGTFDVTLVRMGKNGELFTVVTRGNDRLGGKDWDERIENILIDKVRDETGEDSDSDEFIRVVKGTAQSVKKKLSSMNETSVNLYLPDYGKVNVRISREEFENNTRDLLSKTGILCRNVLNDAGISPNDLTDILLVGGSTRMPQVSEYLFKEFHKKPVSHVNPDEAVAIGAAIAASKEATAYTELCVSVKSGEKVTKRDYSLKTGGAAKEARKIEELSAMCLRENTAHAMGVVAINSDKNVFYNEVIIPANHPRPVRAAKRFRFFTKPDSENKLEIYLVQGDSKNLKECFIQKKYTVTGIRHVNKGDKYGTVIRVQYSYDDNGIMHVQARQENDTNDLPIEHDSNLTDADRFTKPVNSENIPADSMGLMIKDVADNVMHKYKTITFSNVEWERFDNIAFHESGAQFNEPDVHIVANEENIEFHGYNVSAMDEGVSYSIPSDNDFEIECEIDTSTIKPHPGGMLKISLGILTANLNENGGAILLDGEQVANVGSRFKLKMMVKEGKYSVFIDDQQVAEREKNISGWIDIIFGFEHGSHCCELLSHAYITGIEMHQGMNKNCKEESSDTDTWED